MALDIRLDYIDKIDPEAVEQMTRVRGIFMKIDDMLKIISDVFQLDGNSAGLRTVAISRTNLETSLQYAIKSLCLMGEEK